MRRMLERIAARISGFVEQRDNLVMLVQASATTGPAFVQILAHVADSATAALYHTIDAPFTDPEHYVQDAVNTFIVFHDGLRAGMVQDGLDPLPMLPEVVSEAGLPPVLRLRELMVFSRSLLPQPDSQVVVWSFFPTEIQNPESYARFIRELTSHTWPLPWCHHMRVFLRADPQHPVLKEQFASVPRIESYEPPLGPEAYRQGYEESVADDTLPVPERMTSLLITAATDYSFGRHALALEKYELLLQYHTPRKELVPMALAWNGVGEVRMKQDNLPGAGEAFEAAIALAASAEMPSPAVLHTISLNLARLRMTEKRYGEAADYYGVAQTTAACMRSADAKLTAIEWQGVARLANGEADRAVELWQAGASVARQLKLPAFEEAMLERLRAHLGAKSERQQEFERSLSALKPVSA